MLKRSQMGRGIWGAGAVVGFVGGACLGACGLAGSSPGSPGGSSANGGSAATSQATSSSTGRHLGSGGAGGLGGAGLGGATPDGGNANGGGAGTSGGRGGGGASSTATGPQASCMQEYGSAPGYVFCVETPTYCDFNLDTDAGSTSCEATCTSLGGACLQAFDNNGPCDLFSDADVQCNDSHYSTTLCRCTHF